MVNHSILNRARSIRESDSHSPLTHGDTLYIIGKKDRHVGSHGEIRVATREDPEFKERFGPRGVLDAKASTTDDATEEPRWGRVGKQVIKDTGPLTRKRMETADHEFVDKSVDFMKRATDANKPFFVWFNSSRMHMFTHVPSEWKGKSGLNFYADGMLQHDDHVGQLLNTLDELGIAHNTIVIYTGDNGVHHASWPDAGVTWFRSEKVTNWEGAFRVPLVASTVPTWAPGRAIFRAATSAL